ncbi:MAG: hypothetical protein EPN40_01925 [Rhodanobacteraceae bacterium]|nr:MAG: hypothetical protein EPN40_01925 [Rhodanobacteraceae bacterium]
MADESVATEQGREFFKFSARYCIAPGASAEDMASDAACFLGSAAAVVDSLIDSPENPTSIPDQERLFAVRHFVRMAENLCMAVKGDLELRQRATERGAHDTAAEVHA